VSDGRVGRLLRRILKVLAGVVAVVIGAALLGSWLSHPKLRSDSLLVRRAGPDVFKLTDIPRGQELSPDEIDGYARRLLAEMSLREKVDQMSGDLWIWNGISLLTVERRKYNDYPFPAGRNRRLEIPPIAFSDGPRGVVMNHSTCFPVAMARGASFDTDLERRVADVIGQEVRAQGGNYFGGICINLLRHPAWGRAQETYGEDPHLLGEMAAAMIEGVQRHNVMGCAKHFALNSIENSRFRVDVTLNERALREVYLPQFRRAVEAGVASVMSAYNKVRGDFCGENAYLLTQVLRREWGFSGFVISDFVFGVHDGVKAVEAGLDVEMPTTLRFGKHLVRAVEAGRLKETLVDQAVLRILRHKIDYATRPDPQSYPEDLVASPAHAALAREVAEQSMVLLKNQDHVLPLRRDQVAKLAVLGRLADVASIGDHGSSRVYPPHVVTPLAGLRDLAGGSFEVQTAPASDLAATRRLAKASDAVVVVVGYEHTDEGEFIPENPAGERGGDRSSLSLRPEDEALILAVAALNPRVVVVVVAGGAVVMEAWREQVPAILMGWYSGMEGGAALARLLFGVVNPSGKLPVTIPRSADQLPHFESDTEAIEYGYYHGYTLLEKQGQQAAFPFGHGLSYTSFSYENLSLSQAEIAPDGAVEITVLVSNTGTVAGAEVAQLYVGFAGSSVDRPVKVLRGFDKVLLEPGERRTVRFALAGADLAYYDEGAGAWRVEPMAYQVLVGGSSRPGDLQSAELRVVAEP
jgi:beta-glucosidase